MLWGRSEVLRHCSQQFSSRCMYGNVKTTDSWLISVWPFLLSKSASLFLNTNVQSVFRTRRCKHQEIYDIFTNFYGRNILTFLAKNGSFRDTGLSCACDDLILAYLATRRNTLWKRLGYVLQLHVYSPAQRKMCFSLADVSVSHPKSGQNSKLVSDICYGRRWCCKCV